MTTVALAEAKAKLSELIERTLAGETVTISRRGQAVVELRAIQQPKKRIDVDAMRQARAMTTMYVDPDGLSFVERLRQNDEL